VDNPLKGIPDKQQKVLLFVGVGAAGYVTWKWFNRDTSGSAAPPVTSATDAELAGTGVIGSNVGASENVGNSSNTGANEVDTNNEWFSEAVDKLANGGWNAQAVQSALGEFLTGQALDSSEASIVRAAVGAMGGYPPSGPMTIKEVVGETNASKLTAPASLKVTAKTATSVTLTWGAVTGAQEYGVYRSGISQTVARATGTTAKVDGLTPGKTYTFYVAGMIGGKSGPRSSGVTVKTGDQALTKPTGVKATLIGKDSARISWGFVYPGKYRVRRSGSSQTWESVDTQFSALGLKPRTRYSYQVAAVSPDGRTVGPWSAYTTFTTKR
jgi:hypothetical protein